MTNISDNLRILLKNEQSIKLSSWSMKLGKISLDFPRLIHSILSYSCLSDFCVLLLRIDLRYLFYSWLKLAGCLRILNLMPSPAFQLLKALSVDHDGVVIWLMSSRASFREFHANLSFRHVLFDGKTHFLILGSAFYQV